MKSYRLTSNHLTKEQKAYVTKAFEFFCQMLLIDYCQCKIWVSVKLRTCGNYGSVVPNDIGVINAYKIEVLADQDEEELISTLAHELVHVKQFIDGKLYHDPSGELMWCGKLATTDGTGVMFRNDDCEFEQEALIKEEILLEMFTDIHPIEEFGYEYECS